MMQLPEVLLQSLSVESLEEERIFFPSELKAHAVTEAVCPEKVWMQLPEDVSQSLRVLSHEVERN